MTTTKKNLLLNTIFNFLIIAYPLIMAPYISRVLGVEGLGIYNYTYSIANYFVLFAMLGINNYGNRSISMVRDDKDKLNETFSSIFLMQALTALLSLSLYLLFALFIVKGNKIYFLIQAFFVVSALFDINWLFFGLEKFKLTITRNTIVKILSLALVFLFVKSPDDLALYTVIMSASFLFSQLTLWMVLRKYVKIKIPKPRACLPHIKPNVMLFIPTITVSLYMYIGKVMVGSMSGMTQVGLYESAEKITTVVSFSLIQAFNTVMLPKISNLVAKNETAHVKESIYKSIQAIMLILCAVSFGIASIAWEFAPLFLGEEFTASGTLAMVFAPMMMASAWASVIRTQYLIPYKMEKEYLGSVIAGAIINLCVNFLLIRQYGALGGVIATVLAQFTVATFQTLSVRKKLPVKTYILKTIPYLVFGLIMFASVRAVLSLFRADGFILLSVGVLTGALIYLSLCFIYLHVTKNPIIHELYKTKLFRFLKKNLIRVSRRD